MEMKSVEAMEFFKEKGIEVVMVEPETTKTMIKWAWEYMDELGAKDEFFKKVWESQKAFGKRWWPFYDMFHLPH
jgi:TRAP-type mannitol/chloroaromatic compound transport system substrate-binding protein